MTMLDFSRRSSWLIVGAVVAIGIAIIAYFGLGYQGNLWGSDAPAATTPVTE
jgi:hypothetical protein